jgi:hypothetical protein
MVDMQYPRLEVDVAPQDRAGFGVPEAKLESQAAQQAMTPPDVSGLDGEQQECVLLPSENLSGAATLAFSWRCRIGFGNLEIRGWVRLQVAQLDGCSEHRMQRRVSILDPRIATKAADLTLCSIEIREGDVQPPADVDLCKVAQLDRPEVRTDG